MWTRVLGSFESQGITLKGIVLYLPSNIAVGKMQARQNVYDTSRLQSRNLPVAPKCICIKKSLVDFYSLSLDLKAAEMQVAHDFLSRRVVRMK